VVSSIGCRLVETDNVKDGGRSGDKVNRSGRCH
jgi:hypothetical protein